MIKHRATNHAALPAIERSLGGGFYAGAEHAVIDSGREYEGQAQWHDQADPRITVRGASCRHDGYANTLAEADALFPKADLRGLANQHAIATMLERFVDEEVESQCRLRLLHG